MNPEFAKPFVKATTAVLVVRQMLGDAIEGILHDVQGAVGEISTMISGQARVGLAEMGARLQGSTPTAITGDGHTIRHMSSSMPVAIFFTTSAGPFTVEFCLEE